ncbi:substrate-binding domain of hmg-CoA reductase [Aspergillus ellipticus CBS 707.79]|uniref:hydroxymethylglutaryl-CoA reductase (NADPH) n=1 Tax=Aspergillus ellipticus CBS 707.79 TaxID=1448320 RepID=A0A319CWG0_9EURO|nr:substrate-binding domain of hmg-CoA reductase [Aspergillus ellipticus CBS 707.79]
MSPPSSKTKAKFSQALSEAEHITRHNQDPFQVRIENFIGYTQVPVGLAGPLFIRTLDGAGQEICAPLATTEAALIASCCRGCKAANACGGVQYTTGDEGMSRGPSFELHTPSDAFKFVQALPELEDPLAKVAESTSKHLCLKSLTPHVIGSFVHILFNYTCGDAAGHNMVTIATERACAWVLKTVAGEYNIKNFYIEGQMASEKKASWGNVKTARGLEVTAWTSISDPVCRRVLGCSSEHLYEILQMGQEACIRNGQHGNNIDVANVLAAAFIATGQDAASITDASWSHLTPEYDRESERVTLSLYFPSLPVGVVGGGTRYATQQEALRIMRCDGAGKKRQLAGFIAAFALALEVSTAASVVNNTFAQSHERLARRTAENGARSRL